MSAQGKTICCDKCGRISNNSDGYYYDRRLKEGGYINNHGRDCIHDYCRQCEESLAPEYACPKCGMKP